MPAIALECHFHPNIIGSFMPKSMKNENRVKNGRPDPPFWRSRFWFVAVHLWPNALNMHVCGLKITCIKCVNRHFGEIFFKDVANFQQKCPSIVVCYVQHWNPCKCLIRFDHTTFSWNKQCNINRHICIILVLNWISSKYTSYLNKVSSATERNSLTPR